MNILNEEQIMKYLEFVDKYQCEMNDEEKEKYAQILEQILVDPNLQAFLNRKFGEIIAEYFLDNPDIISRSSNKFVRNAEGFVVLTGKDYIERKHYGPGIYAKKWIIVNGRSVLIKGLDSKNDICTTLISEQIAREAGYEVATYYPGILEEEMIMLTPSFLKIESTSMGDFEEERIIPGKVISGQNMDISENPQLIREFFKKRDVPENVINELIQRYKSTMLYNIFINARDGHNGNWGVIVSQNNQYRFTPIFDLEGGLEENEFGIRPIYINQNYDDDSMLKYLLEDKEIEVYARRLLNVDMNKVYEDVERTKAIKIPEEKRSLVNEVIDGSKKKISKILQLSERNQKFFDSEDDTSNR